MINIQTGITSGPVDTEGFLGTSVSLSCSARSDREATGWVIQLLQVALYFISL